MQESGVINPWGYFKLHFILENAKAFKMPQQNHLINITKLRVIKIVFMKLTVKFFKANKPNYIGL